MIKVALLLLTLPLVSGYAKGANTAPVKPVKSFYNGKPWRSLTDYDLETSKVTFSLDGKFLAAAGQNNMMVTMKENGRTLKLQGSDYTVRIWNASTWLPIRALRQHESIGDIAFTRDSKSLAIITGTNVTVYRTSDWKVVRTVRSQKEFSPLSFSPQGTILAVGATLLDTTTWKVLYHLPTTGDVYAISFSPDNQTLATGSWQGAVQLWNWRTGKAIRVIQPPTDSAASATAYTLVVFSPDGKLLATSCWQSEAVKLWDARTGQQMRVLVGGKTLNAGSLGNAVLGVDAVAFSPDGKKFVTASGAAMRLWDISTGQVLHTFHGESGSLSAHDVAFAPDGKIVVTASRNATVDVWQVP